jgi:hypothetical protein
VIVKDDSQNESQFSTNKGRIYVDNEYLQEEALKTGISGSSYELCRNKGKEGIGLISTRSLVL